MATEPVVLIVGLEGSGKTHTYDNLTGSPYHGEDDEMFTFRTDVSAGVRFFDMTSCIDPYHDRIATVLRSLDQVHLFIVTWHAVPCRIYAGHRRMFDWFTSQLGPRWIDYVLIVFTHAEGKTLGTARTKLGPAVAAWTLRNYGVAVPWVCISNEDCGSTETGWTGMKSAIQTAQPFSVGQDKLSDGQYCELM